MNQIGFYPETPKIAVLPDAAVGTFRVFNFFTDDTVLKHLSGIPNSGKPGETVSIWSIREVLYFEAK